MKAKAHRLHGHAIVSRDDRIADATGAIPEGLLNDADWAHFQAELDKAVLTVLGRRSHDAAPNRKNRRRLVMSRRKPGLQQETPVTWWWNPADVPLGEALRTLAPEGGLVAVPGGQDVFDHIGPAGFDEFHLARAHRCALPGGRGLFARCESGIAAETWLAEGQLRPLPTRWLDAEAGVSLTIWRRQGGGT